MQGKDKKMALYKNIKGIEEWLLSLNDHKKEWKEEKSRYNVTLEEEDK